MTAVAGTDQQFCRLADRCTFNCGCSAPPGQTASE
jgi:hypothetical protein